MLKVVRCCVRGGRRGPLAPLAPLAPLLRLAPALAPPPHPRPHLPTPHPAHPGGRAKTTKAGKPNKAKGSQQKEEKADYLDLIDELTDDEGDGAVEEEAEEMKDTPLSQFLKSQRKRQKSSGKGGKKDKPGEVQGAIRYEMFMKIVDGEGLWREEEAVVEGLRHHYQHHLTLRSSTSLDSLPVELEGDLFPLAELAVISKKDPKRLVIDASSFPQAAPTILAAIRAAGMNLNPQQDGLRIFVPIPKVTREFREQLVSGARRRLHQAKDELRAVQNSHSRALAEAAPPPGVSRDDVQEAAAAVRLVTESFLAAADQLLVVKARELMGK